MSRIERITRSFRARRRRKTIREMNIELVRRYRRKQKALRKKYRKIRNRHHTKEL